MEDGLRFRGWGERNFWEKVIWRPLGVNAELGGVSMSYGCICLKCGGSLCSTPAFRLLGLGLCTEGRG